MMRIIQIFFFCGLLFLSSAALYAQGREYEGPTDGAGDPHLEREGFMRGNRVHLLFKNNTELGDYPRKDASRWPAGIGGNVMHDGISLMVSTKVYLKDSTTPVTDLNEIKTLRDQGNLDSLFFCQANYREEMDRDPTGQIEWGLHPVPGYMNNSSETPAISNDENSWPIAGWPYLNGSLHWPGEWDGRFGRGQIRADLESYFVANDAQDLEFLGPDDIVKYYPKPGVEIGDVDGGVTVQKGQPWGGIGIRVKQRGFQWNNPMSQDCIFWEYTIANTSNYDLPYVAFGYWIDNDIGGENTGEDGSFDKIQNLAFTWDTDGVGEDGYLTGTMGLAFLESPGIFNDSDDNDDDGLTDESRDNDAGNYLDDPYGGITDLEKFLTFYGLTEEDLKAHWSGDEDQDWQDGEDTNENGVYDPDELAGDDIGLDGVAPGELNYDGPDADGTEANHKPDLGPGYAEPNFGWTDVSETDMLGLTTLLFDPIPSHTDPFLGWFRNDQSMWERMTYKDSLEAGATNIGNLGELFASGIFPLFQGKTEFISMAELHSYDDLSGLTSDEHTAPALFTLKKTVQIIYEKDYRFAQPPAMPKLSAIPGDGYVQLLWDDRSDKRTREPILNNENDFEGYKLYRATDKDFTDPRLITDGFGTETLLKPIFQCDKRNGKKGFTDYGLLNGMSYYLGEDRGLAYSFKDETVQNGRTYYYALVAYDYGIPPGVLKGSAVISQDDNYGIAPSENNVVLGKDEFEKVDFIAQNVVIITPGTSAAGQVVESAFDLEKFGTGNGSVTPEIVAPQLQKEGHQYKIKFSTHALNSIIRYRSPRSQFVTNGLYVYDVTENNKLVFSDLMEEKEIGARPEKYNTVLEFFDDPSGEDYYHLAYSETKNSDVFDGIRLNVQMNGIISELDTANSGWIPGSSPVNIHVTDFGKTYYPWDYNIVFSDETVYTGITVRYSSGFLDAEGNSYGKGDILFEHDFNFKVENLNDLDSLGNPKLMEILVLDSNDNDSLDILEDIILVGQLSSESNPRWEYTIFTMDFRSLKSESQLPSPNDVYSIRFNRPFSEADSILFTIDGTETIDDNQLKETMKDIRVVPNPYIATNVMEASVENKYLNQGRRIMFTNLPPKCTVSIFTINGIMVRKLNFPDDSLTGYNGLGGSAGGALHWDMLTREGLEIAAGMYIYHVKDDRTGEEKVGKFGVIY